MGAWGTGPFANDLSSDLKGTFKEVVRLPFSEAELVEALLEAYPSGREADDEEYTDFRLSLADLFHADGIQSPDVFARARAIIDGGDIDMKRALVDDPRTAGQDEDAAVESFFALARSPRIDWGRTFN